jgi:thiamine-phosphate pyrophosphorylase
MFPESTPAVSRALLAAHGLARAQGAQAVQPLHLFQALLQEEEGRPWLLLTQAGADLAPLRASMPVETVAPASALPLEASSKQILAQARELARTVSSDGAVASELLLLALLRADSSLRAQLASLGLDFAMLEKEIVAAHGPPLRLDEPLKLDDLTEEIDAARILDASANRAREALRGLEDYCRFILDDVLLTSELKQLRHDLTEALGIFRSDLLLQGRDTTSDVGTSLSTAREQNRHVLLDVVQAACKRLQESLRSLEELGKLSSPDLGEGLKGLRYRAYTLERAVLLGSGARQRLAQARLYVLVAGSECLHGLERTVKEAAEGGAQVFQLREKALTDRDLLVRACQVQHWCRQAGALFIVNDRPDIARLAGADGVHLGQENLSVRAARRILGPDGLIGMSAHSLDQLRQAVLDGASYLGVGPTFTSQTKEFAEFPGLEYVRQAMAATTLPAFAIGGITVANAGQAVAVGARRLAVGRAICHSEDPRSAAAAIRQFLPTR